MKALKFCSAVALAVASLGSAQAAVVYSQGHVTSASDILNIGEIVVANNVGGGRQAVTVNGINFGTSEAGLGGMVDSGGDFSNQFTTDAAMDNLFSSLIFQNGGNSSMTLTGLIAGQNYLLQLLLQNNINSTGKSSAITLQGQTYNIANFGNGSDYIRINFTASATSETLIFGKNSGNEPDRMVLNAYVLERPIPLPGTLALLSAGIAALGLRRRYA